MPLDTTLDRRTARQLAGRCCYGACAVPALDGSDYCGPHDAHERGRDAAKKRRRRLARAKAGLCVTGCGRKVGKRRVGRKWVAMRRCSACAKDEAKAHRDARARNRSQIPDGVRHVPDGTTSPARGFVRLDTSDKREGRGAVARYVGRSRRGAPSREDLDVDLRREAREAAAMLLRFADVGLGKLRELEAENPTRSQRAEAKILTADPVGQAWRLTIGVFCEVHPDGRAAVREWLEAWLVEEDEDDGDE